MKQRTINLLNKYNLNKSLEEELKTKSVFELMSLKGIGPETMDDWSSTLEKERRWKVFWEVCTIQDAKRLKYELIKAKRVYKHRKFMFIKYGVKTDILIENIESIKERIQSFCEDSPELKEIFKL